MRSITLLIVASIFTASGCAPMIVHSPDVTDGWSGGVSASLGSGPRYENGDDPGPFYWGAATLSTAYGIRPRSENRVAARFGIQAPTDGVTAIDMFLQAPRRWIRPVTAGAGVLAEFSDGRQMPYIQAGAKNSEGYGVNVAVGRYWNRNRSTGYTLTETAQVNWLNFEAPVSRFATLYIHAGYAFGHVKKKVEWDSEPYVDENRWVKLGGATIEIHKAASRRMQADTR